MDLKQGDVVLVPYPYVPRPKTARRANDPGLPEIDQVRPAVIVSGRKLRDDSERVFLVMITKATRPALPGDMVIADLASAGASYQNRNLAHRCDYQAARLAQFERNRSRGRAGAPIPGALK
jgi:PemK-like, MazF-like toxin of type II toxin-antitoxin system